MTDEPKTEPPLDEVRLDPKQDAEQDDQPDEAFDEEGPDSDRFRSLLKLAVEAPPPPPKVDLLSGVQKRLRERSRGKFYADGWSTREDNPRFTYLVTALVMLVLVLVAYFSLVPSGAAKLP